MRYFVKCRVHRDEKVYLRLEDNPDTRADLDFASFNVACPRSGSISLYSTSEIIAEPGVELPLLGTAVGALLFVFTPVAGLIGSIAGLFGGTDREKRRVEGFNKS